MKVGIITFHCAHNYGAVLQAYALQTTLKKFGHEVYIVDYRPSWILNKYSILSNTIFTPVNIFPYMKSFIGSLLGIQRKRKRVKVFNKFINEKLNLSKEQLFCDVEFGIHFDCIILGSDQIWNPKLTIGFDSIYFGRSAEKLGDRVISYAASMESATLTNIDKVQLKELLRNVDSIGVRELALQDLLKPIVKDKEIFANIDPTLLLTKSEWDLISDSPKVSRPYLLIYQNLEDPNMLKIAERIAKKYGYDIVILTVDAFWRQPLYYKNYESPEQFVGWFKNASFVLTTSYHGTAFSIIYNIPFYTLKLSRGTDSRSESLLAQLELSNRFISSNEFREVEEYSIDFSPSNNKLNILRSDSLEYLERECY
jgi:hypothetical protein